jgi:hypothetical protein
MDAMIRIAISQAALDDIAKTLPLGTAAFEGQPNEGRAHHFGAGG